MLRSDLGLPGGMNIDYSPLIWLAADSVIWDNKRFPCSGEHVERV